MTALERLLAGSYRNPDGAGCLTVATKAVVIERGLAERAPSLIAEIGLAGRLALVCDPTTRDVLGQHLERSLAQAEPVVLGDHPKADQATVERLTAATTWADGIVAVGAGVIGDLCKCAAAANGQALAVFGTAPSMNGYASTNAAILADGLKISRRAVAPAGVFLDLDVLAAAPPRMIAAGLGDSLCRPTAQFDWLLAHLLRGEPIRQAPFDLLAEDEEALLAEAGGLLAGDLAAMARLARTLVLSGFGMTICGGSQPASQGEHLIAHYGEMMGQGLPASWHGEQIAVTTLTMARLQRALLDQPAPRVAARRKRKPDLVGHFGAQLGAICWREFQAKRLSPAAADDLNHRLATRWEQFRTGLAAVSRPVAQLERAAQAVGAPQSYRELGWPAAFARAALIHAREIRNRFTALDLAAEGGWLASFARGEVGSS